MSKWVGLHIVEVWNTCAYVLLPTVGIYMYMYICLPAIDSERKHTRMRIKQVISMVILPREGEVLTPRTHLAGFALVSCVMF